MGLGRTPRWDPGRKTCSGPAEGCRGWILHKRIPRRDKSIAILPALCRLPQHMSEGGTWAGACSLNLKNPNTTQSHTRSFHPDHTPVWPQNHILFSPCDFLAMGRRKTEAPGSLPSARTAWTTGDGGMLPEGQCRTRALVKSMCQMQICCGGSGSACPGWWWSCW